MIQNTLGIVLAYYREKNHFSLEQLCTGICSSSTLSRIEMGELETDSLVNEALLGRFGKEVTIFEIMLDEDDYKLWKMRKKIEREINEKHFEVAQNLLAEYQELTSNAYPVHRQYALLQKVKVMIGEKQKAAEIREILREAISISKPDFYVEKEKIQLYNPLEIKIILILIHYQDVEGDVSFLEKKLVELVSYVARVYSGKSRSKTIMTIYMELMDLMEKSKMYQKILQYADEALSYIVQDTDMVTIGEIHFLKGRAILNLYGNSKEWEKIAKEEFMMAYCVFDIMLKKDKCEEVSLFCKEKMNWQIIM